MNLGLAIAKPGESRLGLSLRLWRVNRISWNLDRRSISDRVTEELAHGFKNSLLNIDSSEVGLDAINALEHHHFPEIARAKLPSYLRKTKRVRNCVACAYSGYHSLYFDLPWLEKCPVHKRSLVERCPECRKYWPGPDDVQLRNCDCCGIREKATAKINLALFNSKIYDSVLRLDQFFSERISLCQSNYKHHQNVHDRRTPGYSKTLLYPSVLAAHKYDKYQEWCDLLPIESRIHPCIKKKFRANTDFKVNTLKYITEETRDKMSKVRKKVYNRALQELEELAGHELLSCEKRTGYGNVDYCYHCHIANQLSTSFYRYAVSSDAYGRVYKGRLFSYKLSKIGKISYSDSLLSYLSHHRSTFETEHYEIPERIRYKLYELDLISCIKQLAIQVRYGHEYGHNSSIFSSIDIHDHPVLHNQFFHNYYSFIVENSYVHLYYPKEYEQFSFDTPLTWLAMTECF